MTQAIPKTSPVQIYEPRRQARLGWRVWNEMFRELWEARELLWRLTWRDVLARYKQSILGLSAGLLGPLVMMGVFTYLSAAGILGGGKAVESYPLFVYVGWLAWQTLSVGLMRATSSLVSAADLVGKVRFPRETLVLAGLGQAFVDAILGLPALALLLIYYQRPPAATVVFVPLVLVVLGLLMIGLGLFLALANAALRDVGNVLPAALLVWMFLTPVVYPPPAASGAVLAWLNPASPLITSVRDLTLTGRLSMPGPLALATLVSAVLALASWRLFHLVEPKMAERV